MNDSMVIDIIKTDNDGFSSRFTQYMEQEKE